MNDKKTMNRRGFLGAIAALGSIGVAACGTHATHRASASPDRSSAKLPGRGEFVVRGAHVLTMDPTLGDITGGEIHVRAGEIVAGGRRPSNIGRRNHRRENNDCAAGPDRYTLASVEYASTQSGRRGAENGLL